MEITELKGQWTLCDDGTRVTEASCHRDELGLENIRGIGSKQIWHMTNKGLVQILDFTTERTDDGELIAWHFTNEGRKYTIFND